MNKTHQPRRPGIIYGSAHPGGALRNMVKEYPTVPAVLKELVQNSIDVDLGGASQIRIDVNFDDGTIRYFDNGPGLTPETFEAAVKTFGHSIKRADKYGRFGIGLASPLSIAAEFNFVTGCSGARYQAYEFNRDRLFAVAEGGYPIPVLEVRDTYHEDGRTPIVHSRNSQEVWWRTGVLLRGLTEDKQKRKFDIETFQADIQSAYGKKLVALRTTIHVTVTEGGTTTPVSFRAKLYEGKKLPTWSTTEDYIGRVTVDFRLSPFGYVGPQRIDVGPGNNPSRVPLEKLRFSSFYECLNEPVRAALNSKLFQGEIVGEKLELLASRKGFAKSDALLALTIALEKWYAEVGEKHFIDVKREQKANRYQAISLEVIERLKSFALSPDSPFAQVLAQASFGSIGKEHSPMSPKDDIRGLQVKGKALVGDKVNFDRDPRSRAEPNGDRPGHSPQVAFGPKGQDRQLVKGHSQGFHIVMNDTGERMWHYNPDGACLTVNDTHPVFHAIEGKDAQLRQYILMLAVCALRLELAEDERLKDAAREFAEAMVRDWFVNIPH